MEAKLPAKVEAGMGLLYVSPAVSDPKEKLPQFLPLVNPTDVNWAPTGPWSLTKDHFISSGLAYEAMPRAGAYNYVATGQTLVSSQTGKNNLPVVVVNNHVGPGIVERLRIVLGTLL